MMFNGAKSLSANGPVDDSLVTLFHVRLKGDLGRWKMDKTTPPNLAIGSVSK